MKTDRLNDYRSRYAHPPTADVVDEVYANIDELAARVAALEQREDKWAARIEKLDAAVFGRSVKVGNMLTIYPDEPPASPAAAEEPVARLATADELAVQLSAAIRERDEARATIAKLNASLRETEKQRDTNKNLYREQLSYAVALQRRLESIGRMANPHREEAKS